MTITEYDVIVIGARCAGSPTAMLLARQGYRVLLVDRATFPSDTLSTHLIQPTGVASLRRWGLLDQVVASGCPAIDTYAFDFGPLSLAGSPGTLDSPVAYAPQRTVLDELLVKAAAVAGVEVREAFTVTDVLVEDGRVVGIRGHGPDGVVVAERARVVVGADGRRSVVAAATSPVQYHDKAPLLCGYYAYWENLPTHGRYEVYVRPHRGWGVFPTNENLTLVVGGWPYAEFATNKRDVEGNYRASFDLAPEFAGRIRGARLASRVVGVPVAGYFRKPYGSGWALVGDAAYNRDPITAQGISDAFRDAELCATALDEFFTETRPFEAAMAHYQRTRDERVLPMYEFTAQLASLEPPPAHFTQLLTAVRASQDSMDDFARMNAGGLSPADFFAEHNVGRMFEAAAAAQAQHA